VQEKVITGEKTEFFQGPILITCNMSVTFLGSDPLVRNFAQSAKRLKLLP
jgi:hypothetical protein